MLRHREPSFMPAAAGHPQTLDARTPSSEERSQSVRCLACHRASQLVRSRDSSQLTPQLVAAIDSSAHPVRPPVTAHVRQWGRARHSQLGAELAPKLFDVIRREEAAPATELATPPARLAHLLAQHRHHLAFGETQLACTARLKPAECTQRATPSVWGGPQSVWGGSE